MQREEKEKYIRESWNNYKSYMHKGNTVYMKSKKRQNCSDLRADQWLPDIFLCLEKFIVLALFRSMIHFNFVYGVKKGLRTNF